MSRRAGRSRRPRPPEEVYFPVVPMLDMAFQLLAFFILTFQAPSTEGMLPLDLPIGPAARAEPTDEVREGRISPSAARDLTLRAEAGPDGELVRLVLGGEPLEAIEDLRPRLLRSVGETPGELRLRLIAPDELRYEPAARLLADCNAAGVARVRLERLRDGEASP